VFDRCPLLSGKGSLDATCSKRTFEEAERAPALDTPVINEWVA
jgi:LysR family transcriptional regulator, regulator for bpeEF and oprC